MFVYPHVQPISRTLTGASTVQYQHSEALFFSFVNMLITCGITFLRLNTGLMKGTIFSSILFVLCFYSSFALKKKRLASSEDGSTSLEMVTCNGRLMHFVLVLFFF